MVGIHAKPEIPWSWYCCLLGPHVDLCQENLYITITAPVSNADALARSCSNFGKMGGHVQSKVCDPPNALEPEVESRNIYHFHNRVTSRTSFGPVFYQKAFMFVGLTLHLGIKSFHPPRIQLLQPHCCCCNQEAPSLSSSKQTTDAGKRHKLWGRTSTELKLQNTNQPPRRGHIPMLI